MNRSAFQSLADVRIAEARALLSGAPPCPDGAYYLAGYAVECAFKAIIATRFQQHEWPEKSFVIDCHTHDLTNLRRLAGLNDPFKIATVQNPGLAANWTIVKDWNEQSRYRRWDEIAARDLLDAITDPVNGVLPWIKAHY